MPQLDTETAARAIAAWLDANRQEVLDAISRGVCDWMNDHPVSTTGAIEDGAAGALSGSR